MKTRRHRIRRSGLPNSSVTILAYVGIGVASLVVVGALLWLVTR